MADIKYQMEDNVKQNFLDPLTHLQNNELKEVNVCFERNIFVCSDKFLPPYVDTVDKEKKIKVLSFKLAKKIAFSTIARS